MTEKLTLEFQFLSEHGDTLAIADVPNTILQEGEHGQVKRFEFDVLVKRSGVIDRYCFTSEAGTRFDGPVRQRERESDLESFEVGLEDDTAAEGSTDNNEHEDAATDNRVVQVKSAGVSGPIPLDHADQNVFGTVFLDRLNVERGEHVKVVFEAVTVKPKEDEVQV